MNDTVKFFEDPAFYGSIVFERKPHHSDVIYNSYTVPDNVSVVVIEKFVCLPEHEHVMVRSLSVNNRVVINVTQDRPIPLKVWCLMNHNLMLPSKYRIMLGLDTECELWLVGQQRKDV